MIKIDLITGFLGSGKTTFIKKYASYLLKKGMNIGILENDFGAVNVDMMLLQDLGWFHDHTVITAHSHGDQFCLKSTSVTVCVTSTRNHLQLTVVSHQILKQHHIHIHSPVIILQNPNIITSIHQILRILPDKRRLP